MKPETDNIVTLTDIHLKRAGKPVLSGLNLRIPRGRVTAIIGPSGIGKTTLLELIGGRLRPDKGYMLVDGLSVPDLGRSELFELRKRMGMLFQGGALLSDLNVYENIAFPLREHTRLPEPVLRQLILMKLELVGLRGARSLMPDELSGGMTRRVALARAIVMDPLMVMYDEPFTGLDPISKAIIVKLIGTLNKTLAMTSIVVTHDVAEAIQIADFVYMLGEGRVLASGTAEEIQNSVRDDVRQFLQGQADGPVPFHYTADDYFTDLFGSGPANRDEQR
ncbi:MAG: ATP-binding cassette domain-containing protein [Pseudomonadota bacterium]|nr:ATP-binding cassette domain-containing protein [Pseudomonadota bacterium]